MGRPKIKAKFQGAEYDVTLQQQVMSTALAIQALEALLINQGIIKEGAMEAAVRRIMSGEPALQPHLISVPN